LADTGIVAVGGSPADLAKHVVSEVARWKQLIAETGAKFD